MNLQYEIKPENLKLLEIKQITLNKDKFGALTFDKAYPLLNDIRKIIVEFEELGYQEHLAQDEVNEVDTYRNRLLDYVKRIHDLDPATDVSFNKNVKDAIENEIESFFNSTKKNLRGYLVFLRQEAARKSQDQQSLAEAQKAALQTKKQSEEIIVQLQAKLNDLNKREQKLENKSGKVGAKALAIYFRNETEEYQLKGNRWFKAAIFSYLILIGFVISIYVIYTQKEVLPSWQEGIAKVALFAVIWYAVSFFVRNYNVNAHLAAVNRHRAAVAQTLEDFLASNPTAAQEMLANGTDAMFKHAPIGYITKAEKDSGNPLLEIVNKIASPKSE